MGHYFVNDDNLKSDIQRFEFKINGLIFKFKTDNGVFSKGELDFGTKLLILNVLKLNIKGNILDLGCGYGAIGVILNKLLNVDVEMIDINERAIKLANMNISDNNCSNVKAFVSDGYKEVKSKFNYIITNPPIRVGKTKLYELIIDAKNYLVSDGIIYLVIRKEQGAKSFIKDMEKYYKIEILDKSKGFYIISLKCY